MSDPPVSSVGAAPTANPSSAPGPATGPARQALLQAARTELAAHGPGGLSLRATARRAGVSHAAPKHHFGDRAGLLTVLATDGHHRLTAALQRTRDERGAARPSEVVADLGHTYLGFALAEPAVFELMFRSEELHPEDPDLLSARHDTLGVLTAAVRHARATDGFGHDEPVEQLTVICWAFIHGLVVLVRDGALGTLTSPNGTPPDHSHPDGAAGGATAALAHALTDTFIRGLAPDVG